MYLKWMNEGIKHDTSSPARTVSKNCRYKQAIDNMTEDKLRCLDRPASSELHSCSTVRGDHAGSCSYYDQLSNRRLLNWKSRETIPSEYTLIKAIVFLQTNFN